MGTETVRHDNLTFCVVQVKLNDPLMGTEMLVQCSAFRVLFVGLVKFNNPLMGTETPFTMHLVQSVVPHVKINNPLMGTEIGTSPIKLRYKY